MEGIILALAIVAQRKRWRFSFLRLRKSAKLWGAIPLVIVLACVPLTATKEEVYSVGGDAGVYQAEALYLADGDFSVQHDMPEYYFLDNESDRNKYRELTNTIWTGYYPLGILRPVPTVSKERVISPVSGIFHGLLTFPSVMALFGVIFGIQNMVQCQSVFFIMCAIFIYFIARNLTTDGMGLFAGVLVFVFSPLVLWASRTYYTEMFLTVCMGAYIEQLTNPNSLKWRMSIPLVAFSFFHVSFLLLVPAFFMVHIAKYVRDNDRAYITNNIVLAITTMISYCFMAVTSPQYFFDNLIFKRRLFYGGHHCL